MDKRIDALTATRGFAALMVVFFHFSNDVYPISYFEQFFSGGNIAVSYFFVLSGFVMYLAYYGEQVTYKEFMKRRIARITPLYLFALLITILPPVLFFIINSKPLEHEFGLKLFLNLAFLQAYVPGYAMTMNIPAWSLSVEMFFYLLFPALIYVQRKNAKRFVVLVIAFWSVSQLVHLLLVKQYPAAAPAMHDFIFYNPLFHLNQFLLGMAGGYFAGYFKEKNIGLPSLLLFVLVILLINYFPRTISTHNGLFAPFFLLFIISIAAKEPGWLKTKPMVFLGEISYGIYILQLPVYYYVTLINKHRLPLTGIVFFSIYLCVLILVCTACYYLIEKPMRRWITHIKL